jgi:tRNA threonylcarbamoyladenosine biosynthesis protein TsaE
MAARIMNRDDIQFVSSEVLSASEEQTMDLASGLASRLRPGDLVALEGQLGAGKTCFVRGLARGLGVDPSAISSPTFVICQEHVGKDVTLVHVDAYRLAGVDDLETIGWNELISDGPTIIAVEWPSRIESALPSARIDVTFIHEGANARRISLNAPKALSDRLVGVGQGTQTPKVCAACATCGKLLTGEDEHFPFCSKRCRMADLGRWFAGQYKVSRPMGEQDIDELANEQ